ncbi:uncharacterized protein [Montipora foliosa]|uniref:uncharacterized protein n=1 Tax=Montipora foliosa TaxID=591990 RepID=UPI0035F13265
MSVNWEVQFGESLSESSSEGCSESSEASFCSASDFQSYDDSAEPIATEEEATQYTEQIAVEEEEEDMLLSRFAGETDLPDWCKCGKCSMEFVVQHEECRCCMEIDRCRERMAQVEKDEECVTSHPGFESVCLDRWVLATAAIGLKTKQKKAYTTLFAEGNTTENKFLRSVSYRQFVLMVWEYVGSSNRIPLPCCVYNALRKEFPIQDDEDYHGYEEND